MLLPPVFRIVETHFHCTLATFHAIGMLKCVPDRRLEGAIPDSIRIVRGQICRAAPTTPLPTAPRRLNARMESG